MQPDHDVALPIIGSIVGDAFNTAMQAVWNFAGSLLGAAFGFIDQFTTPNVSSTSGPIAGVVPVAFVVAGVIASLLAFVQIGRIAITHGQGLPAMLMGLGQYALVNASGYGLLAAMIAACTGLTQTILSNGLHVDTWSGISSHNDAFINAAQGRAGVELGLIAVICVIPAALGYLVMALVRDASLLILAGTMPILAAGLLSQKTASWFWKGLRWTVALLLLQPATAFVVAIGFNLAAAASGGGAATSNTDQQSLAMLVIGGLALLISLLCPMTLFKLLAFIEPGTPSGQAFRGAVGGMKPAGARGGSPSVASRAGGGQAGGEAATAGRFGAALSKAHPALAAAAVGAQVAHAVGQRTIGAADNVLSAAGAGHHGAHRPSASSGSVTPGAGGLAGLAAASAPKSSGAGAGPSASGSTPAVPRGTAATRPSRGGTSGSSRATGAASTPPVPPPPSTPPHAVAHGRLLMDDLDALDLTDDNDPTRTA